MARAKRQKRVATAPKTSTPKKAMKAPAKQKAVKAAEPEDERQVKPKRKVGDGKKAKQIVVSPIVIIIDPEVYELYKFGPSDELGVH